MARGTASQLAVFAPLALAAIFLSALVAGIIGLLPLATIAATAVSATAIVSILVGHCSSPSLVMQ